MILRSLYDYTHGMVDQIPPQGTELREIAYVVVIDEQGCFKRFESKRIDKRRCTQYLVAKGEIRTSAPKPNTLWDNGKYVFGFGAKEAKAHGLFVDRVHQIAEMHPEDKSMRALSLFYEKTHEEMREVMNKDPMFEDVIESYASNFSFRLEDDDQIIAEKVHLFADLETDGEESEVIARCLVTGLEGPIVRTTTPTPLPDNSPMAALVSFQVNSGYDSYGKSQAYNAPLSVEAEWAVTAALKKMLGKDSRNKARLGNRMFLFWGSGTNELSDEVSEGLLMLLDVPSKEKATADDKVEKVTKLFKSIYSGQIKTTLDDRFHILGLAPNTGRIAVVLWVDCLLRQFAEKIFTHFKDMEIVDTRKPESRRPYYGVFTMISSVTRGGKLSDALPSLSETVTEAVINGTPYPVPLYTAALERIRQELSDSTVNVQRASILKAYINRKDRKLNTNNKPLQIMLDKTNENSGYLCGRLAAVLEKIQKDAGSGDSMRTRYMGSASSTPAAVFPAMLNVSVHHSEKLSEGTRIYYEQLKQEIMDKMPVGGFPSHLDLNDQGRFFVGYYHQRADLYTKKETED